MYHKVLVFIAFVSQCMSKDLTLGPEKGGVLIFDNLERASPTFYTRYDIIPIRAEENEVIQRVKVTDYDEKKRGKVDVIEGGVGKNLVVLELKSPGVLRGYQFHVEVYAVNKSDYIEPVNSGPKQENPVANRNKRSPQDTKDLIYFEYDSEENSREDSEENTSKLVPLPKIPRRFVPKTLKNDSKTIPDLSKDEVPDIPKEVPQVTTEEIFTTQTIITQ